MDTTPTAADLRAEIARHGLRHYVVAARVGVHPSRLSAYLHQYQPLPPELAQRIMHVIADEASHSA